MVATGLIAIVRIPEVAQRSGRKVILVDNILAQLPVLVVDHRAEYVRKRLVERSRLEAIFEIRRAFDDSMHHFMCGDVERARQRAESRAAVAIGHVDAVPIGVLHRLAILGDMYDRNGRCAIAGDTQAAVGLEKILVDPLHICMSTHRNGIRKEIIVTRDIFYGLGIGISRVERPQCAFWRIYSVVPLVKSLARSVDQIKGVIVLERV